MINFYNDASLSDGYGWKSILYLGFFINKKL